MTSVLVVTGAGVTTSYLVADQNPTGYAQVLDEIQNGAVSRTYSYGLSLISQKLIANGQGPFFYGYDGHGSVRFLTSSTGTITDTYDYDAFGNLIAIAGNAPRGRAVEDFIFSQVLGRARILSQNFPVIDDWFQGIATSIKSIDLTAASYQTGASILGRLEAVAEALNGFNGITRPALTIAANQIKEQVLIVALEDGAATVEQELALKSFLQNAAQQFPNIKVVYQFIP